MVQFGNHLEGQIYPPWAAKYLDYKLLKQRIKDILAVGEDPEASNVVSAKKNIFQGTFDDEVVKILKFYSDKKGELLGRLDELQRDIDALPTEVLNKEELSQQDRVQRIGDLNKRLQDVAREITRLLEYVSLNMRGIRKILKKFAKNVDPTPPAPGFLALEIQHPHDPNWKLLQGTYLSSSVQKDLDDMIEHREPAEAVHRIRVMHDALYNFKHDLLGGDAPGVPVANFERMDTMLRNLSQAQLDAETNSNVVHATNWAAAQAGIFTKPPPEEEAVATMAGLVLNCANSALYMANYNLVVPSIRSFLTHLGASVSLAGLLIGCCDLTSMPSTVGYSYWTNTTFKYPLLFSAACCLAGNVAYVAAYDTRAVSLLYAARLLTGLGAARAVSRRYIADFVSKRERTKASAAFVGSSAMGMALGPLLARLFQSFPTVHLGPLTFNYITMGAYTMAAIWVLYIFGILRYFEDPRMHVPHRTAAPAHADLSEPLLVAEQALQTADAEAPLPNGVGGAGKEERKLKRSSSFARALGPTMVCVYALLVLKTAQQGFVDSLPLITEGLYGWTDGTNGVYLACLGFSMIPVTVAMGAIASRVNDRVLTVFSMCLTLVGCLQLMNGGYPRWNYFLGGVGIYMGTIVMEGAAMSLESKVLHPSFAEGTFNAGLMSTEAGTLGRFTGNLLLSVAGNYAGLDTREQLTKFARLLFGMTAALVASNLVWFLPYYKRMAELGG